MSELEQALLEFLYRNWRDSDTWRDTVVGALAVGGGPMSLEMLEVISVDLADYFPGKKRNFFPDTVENAVFDYAAQRFERARVDSLQRFQRELWAAIKQLRVRLEGVGQGEP